MNEISHISSTRARRLPPILARDYRRLILYPRLAYAATYGSLALIAAIVFMVR